MPRMETRLKCLTVSRSSVQNKRLAQHEIESIRGGAPTMGGAEVD